MRYGPRNSLLSIACAISTIACADGSACEQDVECEPSYTLHLESPDSELEQGLWRVELDIDGGTVSAECVVTGSDDGPGDLICDVGPWTTEPSRPIEVSVSVGRRVGPGSGEPTDTGMPPETSNEGIYVTLTSPDQDAPATSLGVTVTFEDTLVLETQETPSYEVVESVHSSGCGSCLSGLDVIMLP